MHVAVCRSKCLYCDFYSRPLIKDFDWERYLNAIIMELKSRGVVMKGKSEITLYLGGGTPSLIPNHLFVNFSNQLISEVRAACGVSTLIPEITMEVNPDDVTPESASIWRQGGINRISMGVQSLNDEELRVIGRRHDSATVSRAYEILIQYFSNISLDLMFGLPGQTLPSLSRTLDSFIKMRPQHISAYSLMYEERTALTRLRNSGKIDEADEDLSAEMFDLISRKLTEAGYQRYEISNYALPGFESAHNSSYWENIPYIGIGPSAHSYDGRLRRSRNYSDINAYIDNIESGKLEQEIETLTQKELQEERIMTELRTSRGIDLLQFEEDFGSDEVKRLKRKSSAFISNGLLSESRNRLCLTDHGVMISDEIISSLFP